MTIDPNDVSVFDNKGYALYKIGKIDEAIEMATRVISLDKDFANAWYNRAVYFLNENKTDESLSDLNHAIMIDKKYRYDALEDKNFNKIKDNPKFIELLKEFN